MMKALNRAQFLLAVFDAAMLLKDDYRIINNPGDDEYRKLVAFQKLEAAGLIPANYGHVSRSGPSRKCPIAALVIIYSHGLEREVQMVTIRDAMTFAAMLAPSADIAWSTYEVLLQQQEELSAHTGQRYRSEAFRHSAQSEMRH